MNFLKTCALPKHLKFQYSSPFFQFLCVYIQYISSMACFKMLWQGLFSRLSWCDIGQKSERREGRNAWNCNFDPSRYLKCHAGYYFSCDATTRYLFARKIAGCEGTSSGYDEHHYYHLMLLHFWCELLML